MSQSNENERIVAAARDLLHPIIEGVGEKQRCRWQMDTWCPAFHQAQAAADALLAAGMLANPPAGSEG